VRTKASAFGGDALPGDPSGMSNKIGKCAFRSLFFGIRSVRRATPDVRERVPIKGSIADHVRFLVRNGFLKAGTGPHPKPGQAQSGDKAQSGDRPSKAGTGPQKRGQGLKSGDKALKAGSGPQSGDRPPKRGQAPKAGTGPQSGDGPPKRGRAPKAGQTLHRCSDGTIQPIAEG
jgi:hypothetical protein